MLLKIKHVSQYAYSEPVSYALQHVRLRPKTRPNQVVLDWTVAFDHAREELTFEDPFHNTTTLVRAEPDTASITIECEGIVDTQSAAGIVGEHQGLMPLWLYQRQTSLTEPGPKLRAVARTVRTSSDQIDQLHGLSALIRDEMPYRVGVTDATTPAEQALSLKYGVCQDHAHVFISAARTLGFPARYVSGYLMMNDRIDQDATHAWAEVFVSDLGWVGFDVSNGICPDERYVAVATALDYDGAAPISGLVFGASAESLAVSVEVQQQ